MSIYIDHSTDDISTNAGGKPTIGGVDVSNTLLVEHEVTGAAVTSVQLTGLDINTHKSYRVELDIINATASISDVAIYINGDTTATNYYFQETVSDSTTVSSTRSNASRCMILAASGYSKSVGDISLVGGYSHGNFAYNYGSSAVITNRSLVLNKTATVANITQLDFIASVASSIGIGSKIRIYRGDK